MPLDPVEDSVEMLSEWIYNHTYLQPAQADKVARTLLSLALDQDDE